MDAIERGFSFRADAELDLRMDRGASKDAKSIVNSYTEEELKSIFKLYGEIKNAGQLAKLIIQSRKDKEIETTFQLVAAIEKAIFKRKKINIWQKFFRLCE